MLLLDFAFNSVDLFSVMAQIIALNKASISSVMKCGYEEVGRIPDWIRTRSGTRCDEVLFVVTQKKWRPLWKQYIRATERV